MAFPHIPQNGGHEAATPCAAVWAVGVVMVVTPCSVREAHRVLAAAAGAAHVTVEELAAAMAASWRGAAVPAGVQRALRRAVVAARTAGPCAAAARPLVPSRARTEEALARFRSSRVRLWAAPADAEARQAMDDATYTLCVLMGRPTPHEALRAAELRLAPEPAPAPAAESLPEPGLAV
ncbi:DUF5133 domain-containing protein [Streptomyces sp. NPDC059564]|uniref:DUF5133 domain-containing protein n=1 Tax=Streptomyces sp. NPDC059564 TaxID=3346865 RepID=UPI0036AF7308